MSKLILAGVELEGDLPQLRTFREPPFWDARSECLWGPTAAPGGCPPARATDPLAKNPSTKRYAYRPALRRYHIGGKEPPLDAARAAIDKFIFHHDGCPSAEVCWKVLHNERGLSCHFLIDADGTIYQTADLALMAYHAAQFNVSAIGVELNNRGDARKEPDYYRDRRTVACRIGGTAILAWDYTDAQYASLNDLARLLVKHLPNLPLEFPQDPSTPGKQLWGVMAPGVGGDSTAVPGYAGYLGHYHCTRRKWDPGAFDFKRFIGKLKRTTVFPTWPGPQPADPSTRPEIAAGAALTAQADAYYQANEHGIHGGFFPVGPWGAHRLWHGGIHLPGVPDSGVFAPCAGRVVAARNPVATPIGSGNFVLTRHDLNLGKKHLRFWVLAMHLADEQAGKQAPPWLDEWTARKEANPAITKVIDGVEILDVAVDAGSQLGRVGVAGPPDASAAQVHLEIFSRTNLFADSPDWTLHDGTAGGRFCEVPQINDPIDTDHDQRLSNAELTAFFASRDAAALREVVTYHVSEWSDEPDWTASLEAARGDFRKRSPARKAKPRGLDDDDEDIDIAALVEDQLAPFLWWTSPVAAALGLPEDGVVYHYHPIRFIEWVNARLQAGAGKDAVVDVASTRTVDTRVLLGDIDDVPGENAFVDLDAPDPDDDRIRAEHLGDGYDAEQRLFDTPPP